MKNNNSNDEKIIKKRLKSGPGNLDQYMYYTTHKGIGLTDNPSDLRHGAARVLPHEGAAAK
jgi:hypothetical protein